VALAFRIAIDTGGTFTDVVVAEEGGRLTLGKVLTTPRRAFQGVREALDTIAAGFGVDTRDLLEDTQFVIYGTTRATNAILERKTAETAFLTTEGFPDILILKEGGKLKPFNFNIPNPEPYVPRRLTFEMPGRIDAQGNEVTPLDAERARAALREAKAIGVEAVAVCLLWSIANPAHELELGRLIDEELPGIPYTLSHEFNPIIREYRRASSTAIDASLKPLMQEHLGSIENDFAEAGFRGELFVVTCFGGCMHVQDLVKHPIRIVNSGPSMAPIAARAYAAEDLAEDNVIVCDAGGTSFDVSLILGGEISTTRETWLGGVWLGHITGLSSVDVTSIGAGGGSIARIDSGNLLCVGPESAGATPGPACYGRGGTRPTVTDAAVVLGYFNADHFLGGRMRLDRDAAAGALSREVAEPLGLTLDEAAYAVLVIANEAMVSAIQEITIKQGVDPRECVMVAGGGAGGLGAVAIAHELGCRRVLVPRTAGALSACGAQFADIVSEFSMSHFTQTDGFDYDAVNRVLRDIELRMDDFAAGLTSTAVRDLSRRFSVEARYPSQVWELEVEIDEARIADETAVAQILERFHEVHERTFAVNDPGQHVECVHWKGRLTGHLHKPQLAVADRAPGDRGAPRCALRPAYFAGLGMTDTPCYAGDELMPGVTISGPAVLEETTTTVVVQPGARVTVSPLGDYIIDLGEAV
jgi:N-methylhydantoinase A